MKHLFAALLACLCIATATPAFAQACVDAPEPEVVENRDGSRLRVIAECLAPGDEASEPRFAYHVQRAAPDRADFEPLLDLVSDAMDEPVRSVNLIDVDGDGRFEVEARGMCGAGPNCGGDLYRLDASGTSLVHFFSGGYADLRWIDGYLIESGRASCCAWEHHAWRAEGVDTLVEREMDLMITIGADLAAETDDAPARCTFSRRSGDNWQVVDPPGPAWLTLCAIYGDDYHLVTPEQARAEAVDAQEQ